MMGWSLIVVGYLVGTLPTARIVAKLFGLPNPTTQGSGNPGATNMLRIGGKKVALLTFLGDAMKATLPIIGARYLGLTDEFLIGVMAAAVIGHIFPVWYGFRGGKGVATFVGGLIGLAPLLAGGFALTWIGVALITRYSSLAALTAAPVVGFGAWYLKFPLTWVMGIFTLAGVMLWTHRSNVKKLLSGQESKIGGTKGQ